MVNYHKIVYRNIKNNLSRVETVGNESGYEIRVQAYAWETLHKEDPVTPLAREGEWFVLERPIEENCFIIYRGLMYEYELNYNDKRRFKIRGVSASALEMMRIDEMKVYSMTSEQTNREVRKYVSRGIGNRFKNSVDFTLPIRESLVLFNGVDNEYEVTDEASIYYPQSLFSVNGVSNLSFISQVNFTLGL
jgi:hypothetical protein